MPQGMGVQVPPRALSSVFYSCSFRFSQQQDYEREQESKFA
jgi:hypothetical protein